MQDAGVKTCFKFTPGKWYISDKMNISKNDSGIIKKIWRAVFSVTLAYDDESRTQACKFVLSVLHL